MPSDRAILGFDTSAAHCAAALVLGERVLARRVETMAKGQAERLLPMLEELLAEAALRWDEIGAIAVCTGPGNFTGIRIGVAAARGLALGLGVPAVGLTVSELHTHSSREETSGTRAGVDPEAQLAASCDPVALARVAASRFASGAADPAARPVPFYQRDPDARPSAEAPPVLLDE